jgi:MerR family transcriptional regulator, copper efflux regulator
VPTKLTIGELAQQSGIHLETIRYYEREGLLPAPPRTPGGHRAYGPSASQRLRFIKRAQELGFTLAEIRELLDLRREPDQLCIEVTQQVDTKLAEVQRKIRHLQAIERALVRLKDSCEGQCHVSDCPILESLDTEVS